MRWRRRPKPLSCREVVELVSDFVDGVLPEAMRLRMEAHLSGCDPCVAYVGQIRATVALAHQVDAEPVDPAARQRLVDLYRQWQEP
jgi:anti-sigma factor RsiW